MRLNAARDIIIHERDEWIYLHSSSADMRDAISIVDLIDTKYCHAYYNYKNLNLNTIKMFFKSQNYFLLFSSETKLLIHHHRYIGLKKSLTFLFLQNSSLEENHFNSSKRLTKKWKNQLHTKMKKRNQNAANFGK